MNCKFYKYSYFGASMSVALGTSTLCFIAILHTCANEGFNGLDKSEWQASYKENLYRQQLHQPLREYYRSGIDTEGNSTGGAPPRILDSKTNLPIRPLWVPATWH